MGSGPKNIETILSEAVEIESATERSAFLDEACGEDSQLRQRLDKLVSDHFRAGSVFLEEPPAAFCATLDQPITEKPGTQIGPYKLLQQIGEGGMGVVYMAEQKEPVKRRVALKIIKPGMDTRQVIARFEAERQALAMMDHPNIAKVLDAGATESGRPYFVMELVNGVSITQYCDEQHLTPKERLELFVPICKAVQHAHQKGIIHRDLKPSNILVTEYDHRAVPKIIDFGVAKATSQMLTDKSIFTQLGQVVGTLEYMSPEQAQRNQLDIDTRSDIYSLGVVLYELLTGETPFDRERLRSAAFDEMLRIIREEEPSKPSTKVSSSQSLPSIAANRRIEPAKLGNLIRGELDWIVLKAMEKDRARRYETASKFAEDVDHYLSDDPVVACPPSVAYRFSKFARRYRAQLAAAGILTLALLVAVGGVGWAVRDRESRKAESTHRVELALGEVRDAWRGDSLNDAIGALEKAETILAGNDFLAEQVVQVNQWRRDLDMARQLDRLRNDPQLIAIAVSGKPLTGMGGAIANAKVADRAYREAFEQYDLSVESSPPDLVADTILDSRIKRRLVSALHHWLIMKWIAKDSRMDKLLRIAEAVDGGSRNERIREALVKRDNDALMELADDPQVLNVTPEMAVLFATAIDQAGSHAQTVRFLRKMQQVHPDDFWINIRLSRLLFATGKHTEGVGFARAALALRSDQWYSHESLADVLFWEPTLEAKKEAEFHYRESIRLNPAHYWSHVDLAFVLQRLARDYGQVFDFAEVESLSRNSIRLKPDSADGYYLLAWALTRDAKWEDAANQFGTVTIEAPSAHFSWFCAAALHLYNGDVDAYRRCCREMVERFGQTDDKTIAERTAKTCFLAPAALEDLAPAVRLAEFSVSGSEGDRGYPWFVTARALADYRMANYRGASEWLDRCQSSNEALQAMVLSIRAMVQHRLGASEQARKTLKAANELVSRHGLPDPQGDFFAWLRAHILHREAARLVAEPAVTNRDAEPLPNGAKTLRDSNANRDTQIGLQTGSSAARGHD